MGRPWFKTCLQNYALGICFAGDFANPTAADIEENLKWKYSEIRILSEDQSQLIFNENEYEALSHITTHIYGYRITPEFIKGKVGVRVKPKIRYKTLRHALEITLHAWSTDCTNDKDTMCSLVPPQGRPPCDG